MVNEMKIIILSCDFDEIYDTNGAQIIKRHFKSMGISAEIKNIFAGESADTASYSGAVITGSRASVYENLSWVKSLQETVKKLDYIHLPTLGICFGFQAVAQALGGNVRSSGKFEEGYKQVELTREGINHPVFRGFPLTFKAYQSHGDIADIIPEGAEILATSESGIEAYALRNFFCTQFHPEILPETAVKMAARDGKDIGDILNSVEMSYSMTNGILKNFSEYCQA